MKTKMPFVVIFMSLVAGCGAHLNAQGVPPVQPVTDCDSGSCSVELKVADNCDVTEPGTLRVTKKDAKITWTANNPNVTFASDGIVVKNPPSGGIFSDDPDNPKDRKKFSINNKNEKKNGDATNYKYTIKLEGLPGCKPVDPIIMNDCDPAICP